MVGLLGIRSNVANAEAATEGLNMGHNDFVRWNEMGSSTNVHDHFSAQRSDPESVERARAVGEAWLLHPGLAGEREPQVGERALAFVVMMAALQSTAG